MYGSNKDPELLKKVDKQYPGPPKGFYPKQKDSDYRDSESKSHMKERRGKSREKYEEKAEKRMTRRASADQSHKRSEKERVKLSRKEKTSKKKEGKDKKKEKHVVDKTDEERTSSLTEKEWRLTETEKVSNETKETAQTISTVIGVTLQKRTVDTKVNPDNAQRPNTSNLTQVVTNNITPIISDNNLDQVAADDNFAPVKTDNNNLTVIQVVSDTDLTNSAGAGSIPEALSVAPSQDESESVDIKEGIDNEQQKISETNYNDPPKNIIDSVMETDNKSNVIPTVDDISTKEKELEEEKDELPNIETANVKEKKKEVNPEKEEQEPAKKKIKRKDGGKTSESSQRSERQSTESHGAISPTNEAVAIGKTSTKNPPLSKSDENTDALPNARSQKSGKKQKHSEQSSKLKSEPRKRKLDQKHERKSKHAKHSQTETNRREEKSKISNSDLSDSFSDSSDSGREEPYFTKPLEVKPPVKQTAFEHSRRDIPPTHKRLDRKARVPGPTESKRDRVVHRGDEQPRHRKKAVVKAKQPAYESEDSDFEELSRKKGSVCSQVVKGGSPEPPPPGTEDVMPLHSHSPRDLPSDDDRTGMVVDRPPLSRWEREDFDSSSPRPRDKSRKIEKKAPLPK